MGAKFLVGAIVGAFSIWGGVWKLTRQDSDPIALAAPERAVERTSVLALPVESDPSTRSAVVEAPDRVPEIAAAAPPEPLAPRGIASLVEDLRDDFVRHNAENALCELRRAGPEVIAPLQSALHSNDWQQRQLAGMLLADRRAVPATQELADVLVEGLKEGALPWAMTYDPSKGTEVSTYTMAFPHRSARDRLEWDASLFQLAERGTALLLNSDEPTTCMRAAYLLCVHRSAIARERALANLIEHLEDNQIEGDARVALRGLALCGADAAPAIGRAWPGRDEQQRALLGHLLAHLSPKHPGAHALDWRAFSKLGFSSAFAWPGGGEPPVE